MKKLLYTIAMVLVLLNVAAAQEMLKGSVVENGTNARIDNVFIRDINNKQITLTDKNGNFAIRTATGHTLVFTSPGYEADTLYLIDMRQKQVKLSSKAIALGQVNIRSTRLPFDPQKEYPEVYEKAKVYALSPSTWFSKSGRDARRLKRFFRREAEERHVDEVFNKTYVGSIIPLRGQELEDFMSLYRPSYAFLRSNEGASLAAYINDSFKKFKQLPPEKRHLPALVTPN